MWITMWKLFLATVEFKLSALARQAPLETDWMKFMHSKVFVEKV